MFSDSERFDEQSRHNVADSFTQGLTGMVNQSDVDAMVRAQKQM